MTNNSMTFKSRAGAAAAVLLLLVAGVAVASGATSSLSLFAGEQTAPCPTDSTIPNTPIDDPETTDQTIPCPDFSDPAGVSTTLPNDGDNPDDGSSTTRPPRDSDPTSPTTRPPRSDNEDHTDKGSGENQEIKDALALYKTALRDWGRCLRDGGSCGQAPTPADFGITPEFIETLPERAQQAVAALIAKAEQRLNCLAARANGGESADCVRPDGQRSRGDRSDTPERDGEHQHGDRGERGDRGDRGDRSRDGNA